MARGVAAVLAFAGGLLVLYGHDLALAIAGRPLRAPLGEPAACAAYGGLPPGWGRDAHAGMVWTPDGSFVPGSNAGYPEERPARPAPRVELQGFWIDRTEVTNAQFAAFVAATGHVTLAEREGRSALFRAPPAGGPEAAHLAWWQAAAGVSWRHPEGAGSDLRGRAHHPVVHVAHADALAYARWLGRALPSEDQWEYAARGGLDSDALHRAPAGADGKPSANFWQGEFPIHNRAEDGFVARAPVGCYPANPFGLHDMIGNVWEWTADDYLPRSELPAHGGHLAPSPSCDDAGRASAKVIKGGSFLCAANFCARYRVSARHGHDPSVPTAHIGFRTVAAPHADAKPRLHAAASSTNTLTSGSIK